MANGNMFGFEVHHIFTRQLFNETFFHDFLAQNPQFNQVGLDMMGNKVALLRNPEFRGQHT
jgi:hypothetical protein